MANNPRTFGSTWQCCVLAAAMSPKHTSNKLITLAYYSRNNIKIANTNSPIKINSVINISHILLSSSSLSSIYTIMEKPGGGRRCGPCAYATVAHGETRHTRVEKLTLRGLLRSWYTLQQAFLSLCRWHIDVSGWGKQIMLVAMPGRLFLLLMYASFGNVHSTFEARCWSESSNDWQRKRIRHLALISSVFVLGD